MDADSILIETLMTTIKTMVDDAVAKATSAESSSSHALLKTANASQEITSTVLFAVLKDAFASARSIPFIFGPKSFVGYANDANGEKFTHGKDGLPEDLSEWELVNRRTLTNTLKDISISISEQFISSSGDAVPDGAEHVFSNMIIGNRGSAYYPTESGVIAKHVTNEIVNRANLARFVETALQNYIGKSNGSATQILVSNVPTEETHVLRKKEAADFLSKSTGGTVASLKVTAAPTAPTDVARFCDITSVTTQPVFCSGPIASGLDFVLNENEVKSRSSYKTFSVAIGAQPQAAYVSKLLSLTTKVTHDNSDQLFTQLFSAAQRSAIPGSDLPTAASRLPNPIDFNVYLEADIRESDLASYFNVVDGSTSRGRCRLETNHALSVDKDGDLSLIVKNVDSYNVPWKLASINSSSLSKDDPRLHVVVNRWSYYPQTIQNITTPAIFVGDRVFIRQGAGESTGDITRTFGLYAVGVTERVWSVSTSSSSIKSVSRSTDTNTGCEICTIVFKNLTATETGIVTVSLSGKDSTGSAVSLSKPVNVTLRNSTGASEELRILNADMTFELVSNPSKFSFKAIAAGGTAPYSFSITTSGTTADSCVLENGVCSFKSTLATSKKINLTVTDAKGLVVSKLLTVTTAETTSFNCFPSETYVLTTVGSKQISTLAIDDILMTVDHNAHAAGIWFLTQSPILEIGKSLLNGELFEFEDLSPTPSHRFGTEDGKWIEANALHSHGVPLVTFNENGMYEMREVTSGVLKQYCGLVWNLQSKAKTFLVSNKPNGPWFLVHNTKLG